MGSGKWGEPAARRDELRSGAPLDPRGIEHLARARARGRGRATVRVRVRVRVGCRVRVRAGCRVRVRVRFGVWG